MQHRPHICGTLHDPVDTARARYRHQGEVVPDERGRDIAHPNTGAPRKLCFPALARDLGDNIRPARLAKFAREGAVAPVNLLSDFGTRRRVASLVEQMLELETALTDSAIALFERLTGQLFTRSRNREDLSWSASKAQARRPLPPDRRRRPPPPDRQGALHSNFPPSPLAGRNAVLSVTGGSARYAHPPASPRGREERPPTRGPVVGSSPHGWGTRQCEANLLCVRLRFGRNLSSFDSRMFTGRITQSSIRAYSCPAAVCATSGSGLRAQR